MANKIPAGYTLIEWVSVHNGMNIYEAEIASNGQPHAYGPYKVVDAANRKALDPIANTEFVVQTSSTLCVRIGTITGTVTTSKPTLSHNGSWPTGASLNASSSVGPKAEQLLDVLYEAFLSRMTAKLPSATAKDHADALAARGKAIKELEKLIGGKP